MDKQRERSRAVHPFEAIPTGIRIDNVVYLELPKPPDVKFVGYKKLASKTSIHDIWIGSKPTDYKSVDGIKEGQEASIILRTTPFYAEMGGQVGDTGWVQSPSGKFQVINTISIPPYFYIHQGHVTEGSLTVGDEVEAGVSEERRLDIARNHTATHLLQFALRRVLGEHVQQRGSVVTPDQFRFDFSHLGAMAEEEIAKVQRIVNEKIRDDQRVFDQELPYKQAIEEGATALFDEKYSDMVRVVKIGRPAISAELCGGTHVTATGEIGFFPIVTEASIGAGLRRIVAVTGRGAAALVKDRMDTYVVEVAPKQVDVETEFKR